MLRLLWMGLLTSTVVVLALDLQELMARNPADWPGSRKTSPVTMEPPREADQIRPYLPRTNPVSQDGRPPKLPGVDANDVERLVQDTMTFHRGPKATASAVGRIDPGTAGELERFLLAQNGEITRVVLHSPGGSVRDGLEMGRMLRDAEITTEVPDNGYCASSCPLVFAGGKARVAGQKAWIGVHQIYADRTSIGSLHDGLADAQRVSATCQQHLVDMDVNPEVWIYAMRTPKHALYIFRPRELANLDLATEIVPPLPPEDQKGATTADAS